jgi:hypothetical protein
MVLRQQSQGLQIGLGLRFQACLVAYCVLAGCKTSPWHPKDGPILVAERAVAFTEICPKSTEANPIYRKPSEETLVALASAMVIESLDSSSRCRNS